MVLTDRALSGTPPVGLLAPEVAVVIPAHGQPEQLKDAVTSALRQSISSAGVVIVNDGCRYARTDEVARAFARSFPESVIYVRKPNGGLSSARNHGIRVALDAWPSVRAVFPLDADNKLSPQTLELLLRALDSAPSEVAWAYQDATFFGAEHGVWATGVPFSTYRLLHENYCDAGSLIRRDVFEQGDWYDEAMRHGYEDWEFFLRVALRGRRAVHVPGTGFLYRRRGNSMLTQSQARHQEVYGYITERHAKAFRPNSIATREHEEAPRYALIEAPGWNAIIGTDLLAGRTTSLRELAAGIAGLTANGSTERQEYAPPVLLFGLSEAVEHLRDRRLLPGIALTMQRLLARSNVVTMRMQISDDSAVVRVSESAEGGVVVLAAVSAQQLLTWAEGGDAIPPAALSSPVGMLMELGVEHLVESPSLLHKLFTTTQRRLAHLEGKADDEDGSDFDVVRSGFETVVAMTREYLRCVRPEPAQPLRVIPHSTYQRWRHVEQGDTFFPRTQAEPDDRDVVIAVPWLYLGGVEQCVLRLAGELQQSSPELRLHLLVTQENALAVPRRTLSPFDTVTFAAGSTDQMMTVLEYGDVVLNAHSAQVYELLPRLKSQRPSIPVVSYLHVIDQTPAGVPAGYPPMVTRRYETLIDHFLVVSEHLRRYCLAMGVPGERVTVLPNAPAVRPASPAAAAQRRNNTGGFERESGPLRMLFVGRFDRQKGVDRLAALALELQRHDLDWNLTVVGKAVMDGAEAAVDTLRSMPQVTLCAAAAEPSELADYYENTDVLLMPSRWEGMPLVALEGMAFGCTVVASPAGALRDLIDTGRNGFIVDDLVESDFLRQTAEIIEQLGTDRRLLADVGCAAIATVEPLSWSRSAADLAALLER